MYCVISEKYNVQYNGRKMDVIMNLEVSSRSLIKLPVRFYKMKGT